MIGPKEIVLNIVEGKYVKKPDQWVRHRRSNNYIAHLVGISKRYNYNRLFLERVRVGRETYFLLPDFEVGELYEIVCVYYTGSGRPSPNVDAIYELYLNDGEKLHFRKIEDEEYIIRKLSEKYPQVEEMDEEISHLDKVLGNLRREIEERRKRLREMEETLRIVKEEERLINEEIKKIDLDAIERRVDENSMSIIRELIKIGMKRGDIQTFEDGDVKIKARSGEILYARVGGTYLISQYGGRPSLLERVMAYKKLKQLYDKYMRTIGELMD